MAGIFERVKQTATDRVPSHLLEAAFLFKDKAIFTNQQIVDALNAKVQTPLAGAELTDLANIATALAGAGSLTNRMDYLNKVRAAFIGAESGSITEAQFRSILGIA
jgi:hypothetical protein